MLTICDFPVLYEGVSKSFRTGRLEGELQMVQLSATRCNCIAILWVSLVSFAAITLYVASQLVFIVVSVYFVIDSVRKLLDASLVYFRWFVFYFIILYFIFAEDVNVNIFVTFCSFLRFIAKEWRIFLPQLEAGCCVCNSLQYTFSMQSSFVLPIVWYLADSHVSQVSHASFNMMDELASRLTVDQIAVSLMKWHLVVPFLSSAKIDRFSSLQQQHKIV
jgi:hypothetical protein